MLNLLLPPTLHFMTACVTRGHILPQLPATESLAEVRNFLSANLHFNGQTTRDRYAYFITHGSLIFSGKNELHSPFADEKTVFLAHRVIVIRHKGKQM